MNSAMQAATEFNVSQQADASSSSTGAASEADALEMPVDACSPADAISGVAPGAAEPKKIRYRAKPKFSFPLHARAVLLDLDGTLLDTVGDIIAAANMMRATLGFAPLEAAVIRNFVGKGIANLVARTLKDAVGEVGPTALKVAVANFDRQYETCFTATSKPYPRVLEGLDAFREAGLRLGCVTNKATKFTEPLLAATGLRDYFEIVVSGDTLAEKKPDIKPEEMLMIGDSINDAEAARAAGSPVFIVPYGYNEGIELRGLDCDAFIDNIPAALKFVKLAS